MGVLYDKCHRDVEREAVNSNWRVSKNFLEKTAFALDLKGRVRLSLMGVGAGRAFQAGAA